MHHRITEGWMLSHHGCQYQHTLWSKVMGRNCRYHSFDRHGDRSRLGLIQKARKCENWEQVLVERLKASQKAGQR
jgi:hypothetical protein